MYPGLPSLIRMYGAASSGISIEKCCVSLVKV